jgi:hypothetical protein
MSKYVRTGLKIVVAAIGFAAITSMEAGAYTCGPAQCRGGFIYVSVPGNPCVYVKTPKTC